MINSLEGKRFGMLTVTDKYRKDGHEYAWLCICDCGNQKYVRRTNLIHNTMSCGCWGKGQAKRNFTTHGRTNTAEYRSWCNMKRRCYEVKNNRYKYYGAKGIIVCQRWLNSFDNFFADMGEKPTKEYSIERNDYTKNYEPSNCRWATRLEQARNKTNNHRITFNGENLTLTEWSIKFKVGVKTLSRMVLHTQKNGHKKTFEEIYNYYLPNG